MVSFYNNDPLNVVHSTYQGSMDNLGGSLRTIGVNMIYVLGFQVAVTLVFCLMATYEKFYALRARTDNYLEQQRKLHNVAKRLG